VLKNGREFVALTNNEDNDNCNDNAENNHHLSIKRNTKCIMNQLHWLFHTARKQTTCKTSHDITRENNQTVKIPRHKYS